MLTLREAFINETPASRAESDTPFLRVMILLFALR
jgi:hypothetical protein